MAEREKNEDTQRLKDLAEKRKLTRRQKKVDEIISKRRKLFANQDEGKVGQFNEAPEDIEVEEDPREKGWLNLSSHRKRRKYSRKKCWICRSSTHYKSRCPFIKCFYCHQYGHMKINCHKRMIEYVFNRVMEDYERKKNKMEQNGIERKKKETGNLKDKPLNRTYKKIEPERLKRYVKEHPEATQQEMAEEFGCCNQAISKALKRNKITRKKRRFITKNRIQKK